MDMKKITKVLGILAFAAGVFASCTKSEVEVPAGQLVGIWVDNANFASNSAEVKLQLQSKAVSPVTVNLGTYQTTPSFGKQIPASMLSIPESVVIAAGDSIAKVPVTVNPSSLEAGKYQAIVAITKASGADVLSNRSSVALNLVYGDIRPEVTLEAAIDDYLGDEAELTVKITGPFLHETPATVKLAVASDSEVPAAALAFEPTVQIAAGKGSATVPVTIDRSKVTKGGLVNAIFEVVSVSDNVIDASEKASFPVFNVVPAVASAWNGRYYGAIEQGGKTYDAFIISGVTDAYWDLSIVEKPAEGEIDPADIIFGVQEAFEAYCARYSGNTRAEILYYLYYAGNYNPLLTARGGGQYIGYIVGLDENGIATGNYTSFEFEIESKDPLPAYAQWIGNWDLDGTEISIAQDQVNKTYTIQGLEMGIDETLENELGVTAVFDEETGGFTLSSQSLGTWDTGSYGVATDKLCGLIQIDGKTYYVDDPVVLASVTMSGADKAVWTPGSFASGAEGEESVYAFTGIKYYWIVSAGAGRYSDNLVALPNTMTRVVPASGDAVSSGLTRRPAMAPVGTGRKDFKDLDHVKKLEIR